MFGKWSQQALPHRGWACLDVEDLGAPSETCQMCESQQIRFVHRMVHPDYPGELACGCVCAGRMAEDLQGAVRRERAAKRASTARQRAERKAAAELAKWTATGWRLSQKGNPYRNAAGCNITVYPQGGGWGVLIRHGESGAYAQPDEPFATEIEAKRACWPALQRFRQALPEHPARRAGPRWPQ